MSRVLFLVNLMEHGSYTCHARVSFASTHELQEFLVRNSDRERDGWSILITRGPSRGYDGKPLHHADIRLSSSLPLPERLTPLPSLEMPVFTVNDSAPGNTYGTGAVEERPHERRREHLTWQEEMKLQKSSKALLLHLGVSDLGRWR